MLLFYVSSYIRQQGGTTDADIDLDNEVVGQGDRMLTVLVSGIAVFAG